MPASATAAASAHIESIFFMGCRYREDGTGLPGTNTFNRETHLI